MSSHEDAESLNVRLPLAGSPDRLLGGSLPLAAASESVDWPLNPPADPLIAVWVSLGSCFRKWRSFQQKNGSFKRRPHAFRLPKPPKFHFTVRFELEVLVFNSLSVHSATRRNVFLVFGKHFLIKVGRTFTIFLDKNRKLEVPAHRCGQQTDLCRASFFKCPPSVGPCCRSDNASAQFEMLRDALEQAKSVCLFIGTQPQPWAVFLTLRAVHKQASRSRNS